MALVGIADPADSRFWRIAIDDPTVERLADAEELLRKTQPDLVSVCTPNKFHCELTLLALRAGCHVACEKPMAMTVAEAETMENARAAAGTVGCVNFSYRNVPAFRFARSLVRSGELGAVTRVNAVYLQSFMAATTTGWSWRNDIGMAGFGALGDLGVHMIDAVRFVTGHEFHRVVGLTQTVVPAKKDRAGVRRAVTTDTNASFLAELSEGAVAICETTQAAAGYGDHFRLEVTGEHCTLVVRSERPDEVSMSAATALEHGRVWTTNLSSRSVPPELVGGPASPGAVVDAVRGDAVDFPTFADGLAAQRVLGAILDSTESGAWTSVT